LNARIITVGWVGGSKIVNDKWIFYYSKYYISSQTKVSVEIKV